MQWRRTALQGCRSRRAGFAVKPETMTPPVLIALSCAFLVLNLTAFMTVAAVLPSMIAAWGMSNSEAGWLGGIYFAGYICAVPVIVPLTDRIPPKRVYLSASLMGALAALGFALLADGFWSGLALRFVAGAALAGAYMPALKALADALEDRWRSRASSYYTSVFGIGTAVSILAGGAIADGWGWRWSFAAAGLGNLAALAIGWLWLPTGSSDPASGRGRLLVDFRPVLRNRAALAYILGYAGHVWEVFAVRIWLVAYLAWVVARDPSRTMFATPVAIATVVALVGVPVAMWCGERASRTGRRRALLYRIYAAAFVVGLAAASAPWLGFGPDEIAVLAILYGAAIYADTGTVNSGVVLAADPAQRGATMAVHAFVGFFGAMLGPALAGIALDLAGGRNAPEGWFAAWAVALCGGLIAALSVRFVGKRTEQ